MNEPTEVWWCEIRLWPMVWRVEAEVYLETRGLPGMLRHECLWNDHVAFVWRSWERLRRRMSA